jgi:hypothetical protein
MTSETVATVELRGDKVSRPEPESVRVALPFGDVDVVRCSDGSYWVHFCAYSEERAEALDDNKSAGRIVDARLDIQGMHTSAVDRGDFANPNLYHVAFRVAPQSLAEGKGT